MSELLHNADAKARAIPWDFSENSRAKNCAFLAELKLCS